MAKTIRRKAAAERKERNISVWVTKAQGHRLDEKAKSEDLATGTWARTALIKAAGA